MNNPFYSITRGKCGTNDTPMRKITYIKKDLERFFFTVIVRQKHTWTIFLVVSIRAVLFSITNEVVILDEISAEIFRQKITISCITDLQRIYHTEEIV